MTRVLLFGSEPALPEELGAVFAETGGFAIAACTGGAQLTADLAAYRPDIVVIDSAAESVADFLPLLQHLTPLPRVVLRTRSASWEFVLTTIALGVRGVILEPASAAIFQECLTSVSRGELWFDKSLFADEPTVH